MPAATNDVRIARRIRVRGVVQGVGFRPFVYRLACAHRLAGWVRNDDEGVQIHAEGAFEALDAFVGSLLKDAPAAARVASLVVEPGDLVHADGFEIRGSRPTGEPTTRITPDLPICHACLRELFDATDPRYLYPYINCTDCGPRFSIVRGLPYDRMRTTMAEWPMCVSCLAQYSAVDDRRFHAQPVACPACGPQYRLVKAGVADRVAREGITAAAEALRSGQIVAIKGIGGYHLACDAGNPSAVLQLRQRKYRKEQAFALMVRNVTLAERTVELVPDTLAWLTSIVRPIVLAPARVTLEGVAPDNTDLGVMLPYAPIHHLLFAAGAPGRLVLTSGNRSSEPLVYDDREAVARLADMADALLIGGRAIARRVDDSVVRAGPLGPVVLRRGRGLAPSPVTTLETAAPLLAVGGDLKNAITLVVDGQAFVSQHIGDLAHPAALQGFDETVRDLLAMYHVELDVLTVVHDAHPQYLSTARAQALTAAETLAVQHHRAHVASVLAERQALDKRVIGVAFDGTGYGDDGHIWGGELFVGSIDQGFERVVHLREAPLPGGDAAARHPVQAAAGFLSALESLPEMTAPPFSFPARFEQARALVRNGLRLFPTSSVGRLFDAVAALLGFRQAITFEGQAALWLEQLARRARDMPAPLPCSFTGSEIDWRDTLAAVLAARGRGQDVARVARGFHRALAQATAEAIVWAAERSGTRTVVLAGGVMQNELLLTDLRDALSEQAIDLWMNRAVPPGDGGLSLGQAALSAFAKRPIL